MLLSWFNRLLGRPSRLRTSARRPVRPRPTFRPQVEGLEERVVMSAVRLNPGFNANSLAANDDGSTGLVPIGFNVNLFGLQRNACWVNNNGNVTFDAPNPTFTPSQLTAAGAPQMIAAYFADVDTRNAASNLVKYGSDTIGGRAAFGVNFINVGYFASHVNKLNSFQIVLINRAETGAGNFDIEFNYEKIQWETGDASGGTNGLGGTSARVGYTNGTGTPGTNFELPGSGVHSYFLDSSSTGLIHHSLNSCVLGRYTFFVRNGAILNGDLRTRYYATGADAGGQPEVKVYDAGTNALKYDFVAYDAAFSGGVRVALGDVNGDNVPDIITAPGAGGVPYVKIYDGATGAFISGFYAFDPRFTGGVSLAAGDVNGDGVADIITGAGYGGGPHVKAFDGVSGIRLLSFFAFDPNFFGGVTVATGNLGNLENDIVVGAGPGGGPNVRTFNGLTGQLTTGSVANFFAFDPTFTGGVSVAVGSFGTSDCNTDIVTSAMSGGGPHVRLFNGMDGSVVRDFFVGGNLTPFLDDSLPQFSGLRVAATLLNRTGSGNILITFGPGHSPAIYNYNFDLGRIVSTFTFNGYDPAFTGGVFIAGSA